MRTKNKFINKNEFERKTSSNARKILPEHWMVEIKTRFHWTNYCQSVCQQCIHFYPASLMHWLAHAFMCREYWNQYKAIHVYKMISKSKHKNLIYTYKNNDYYDFICSNINLLKIYISWCLFSWCITVITHGVLIYQNLWRKSNSPDKFFNFWCESPIFDLRKPFKTQLFSRVVSCRICIFTHIKWRFPWI